MKSFLKKASGFVVVLALFLLLVPNVTHADTPSGSITFADQMYNPHPTGTSDNPIFVNRNFDMGLAITSVNEISKVTVEVENFKTDMVFSPNASCKYCIGYMADIKLASDSPDGMKDILVTATDVNGYSATHTYQVVLGVTAYPLASLTLDKIGNVKSNETFSMIYKLSNVYSDVYGQDVTLDFDNSIVEFVSADSLDNDLKILAVKTTERSTRLILSSIGQKTNTTHELIKFNFKAKAFNEQKIASINIGTVKISDSKGKETQVGESRVSVVIGTANKTLLNNTITNAQSVHDTAVEGTSIGNYPVGSKAILKAVIDQSQLVSSDENSTQEQVNLAKSQLEGVVTTFKNSIIGTNPNPNPNPNPSGDINNDSKVSIGDIGVMAAQIGKSTISPDWISVKSSDLNNDGKIDIEDLIILAKIILLALL